MSGYVLDASVVLSWLVSPHRDIEALAFNFIADNKSKIYSHSYIDLEISNALSMISHDINRIESLFSLYKTTGIFLLPVTEDHMQLARSISIQVNDTVYDALYHSVATLHSKTFVTMDKKYFNKAKHLGNIELLK